MIFHSNKIELKDLVFGLLSFLEIHFITLFGTQVALRYVKNFGLISLLFYRDTNRPTLNPIFNYLTQRLKSDQPCFKTSLILYYLYKKINRQAVIAFGVKKINGKLTGHCWVTLDGQSLERNDYTPIRIFQ